MAGRLIFSRFFCCNFLTVHAIYGMNRFLLDGMGCRGGCRDIIPENTFNTSLSNTSLFRNAIELMSRQEPRPPALIGIGFLVSAGASTPL
jgi:hypothetical protein